MQKKPISSDFGRFLLALFAGGVLFSSFLEAAQGDEIISVKELATTPLMKQVKELLEHGKAEEALPVFGSVCAPARAWDTSSPNTETRREASLLRGNDEGVATSSYKNSLIMHYPSRRGARWLKHKIRISTLIPPCHLKVQKP